jgi:UDP-glucose:(heptosyl)LPS alpha-1,3-glucosyltransferase
VQLTVISQKVAADLQRFYGRDKNMTLSYYGRDPLHFSAKSRAGLRQEARRLLDLDESDFAVLLVGNDWKKKGLPCLLEAVESLKAPAIKILVAGSDTKGPYLAAIRRLENRLRFLPLRRDVEFYYAAADTYAGPSLEDAFALPPMEAMACGVPVIVSREAGVSEIITHGVDGFILENPRDSRVLASLIQELYTDADLRHRLGENAANTALKYTWEGNAEQLRVVFDGILTAQSATPRCPATVRC